MCELTVGNIGTAKNHKLCDWYLLLVISDSVLSRKYPAVCKIKETNT